MQTMSNYPGVVRRALVSAGAVIGLVAVLTTAAAAAPDASVTIAERTAASSAGRAARPKAKPEPSARHETDATQGTPISVVISSSHVRRGTEAPCRSCRNKPSTTMPASCCGGIDRAS